MRGKGKKRRRGNGSGVKGGGAGLGGGEVMINRQVEETIDTMNESLRGAHLGGLNKKYL